MLFTAEIWLPDKKASLLLSTLPPTGVMTPTTRG
jgi:hypothetical protein